MGCGAEVEDRLLYRYDVGMDSITRSAALDTIAWSREEYGKAAVEASR